MRGRRPEKNRRCHVSLASRFTDSLERTEHDADGRGSFAAVERSISDRLLKAGLGLELPDHVVQSVLMQGGYRQEL